MRLLKEKQYLKLREEHNHILHLEQQEQVTCPVCKTKFKPNFDPAHAASVKESYKRVEEELQTISKQKEKLEEKIELYKKTLELKKTFASKFVQPKTNPILNHILLQTDRLTKNFNYIHTFIPLLEKFEVSAERIRSLEDKLGYLEKLDSKQVLEIEQRKKELSIRLTETVERINKKRSELQSLSSYLKDFDNIKKLYKELRKNLDHIRLFKKSKVEQNWNEFINNVIMEVKQVIAEVETKYINYKNLQQQKEELERDLEEYKKRLDSVIQLEKYLSPSKGIIGEYISKSMNVILERMNEIISKIWTYDIRLLPTNIEDGQLTFKFPIEIVGSEVISDVSQGSSSMKEVIDLAFKIVAYEFLDMLDMPLILDEFGRTMDETHRIRAYNFLEELAKDYFSQVYVVSHFESMYARFVNTDIIILNKDNLTFDVGEYNKVVKIK